MNRLKTERDCHFHSFVWVSGNEFVEQPGEICHRKILDNTKIGRKSQKFLLPEFNVMTRRLELEGLSYVSFMKEYGESASLKPFRTRRARNKLKHYLKERFGSPRALAEFAEDYWEVACCQLESLLVEPLPTRKLSQSDLQELTDPLIVAGPSSPSLISDVDWSWSDQRVLVLHINLGAVLSLDDDTIFTYPEAERLKNKLALFAKEFSNREWYNIWLAFYRDGQYVAHGRIFDWSSFLHMCVILESPIPNASFLPIHEIRRIKREILLRGKNNYHAWKEAFLKQHRRPVWDLPFDFAYVIGARAAPRGIPPEELPPSE